MSYVYNTPLKVICLLINSRNKELETSEGGTYSNESHISGERANRSLRYVTGMPPLGRDKRFNEPSLEHTSPCSTHTWSTRNFGIGNGRHHPPRSRAGSCEPVQADTWYQRRKTRTWIETRSAVSPNFTIYVSTFAAKYAVCREEKSVRSRLATIHHLQSYRAGRFGTSS